MAKYIALSDLHLGQNGSDQKGQYSLLSRVPASLPEEKKAADAMQARLCAVVKKFAQGQEVTLIVAGDLLDLSLAYLGDALGDLGALLAQLPEINRLIWVVGNHDHHVWMLHCEEKYILKPLRAGGAGWMEDLRSADPGVTSLSNFGPMYRPTDPAGETLTIFQKALADAAGHPLDILVAYPSFRLSLTDQRPGLPANLKDVLFYVTHGHLFGGIYTWLSQILQKRLVRFPPERVAATVNLSLIEFIYWLLGETGEGMGADGLVETIYTDLQKGNTSTARALISDLVGTLVDSVILNKLVDALAERFLAKGGASSSGDRHADTSGTRAAMEKWCANLDLVHLPRVAVVYGHTHVGDLHSIHSTGVSGYNLGSWLVEPGFSIPDNRVLGIDDGPPQLKVGWLTL
jgi:UDP-2,3-diacylglucosamine pyrophosphatase LpxH